MSFLRQGYRGLEQGGRFLPSRAKLEQREEEGVQRAQGVPGGCGGLMP